MLTQSEFDFSFTGRLGLGFLRARKMVVGHFGTTNNATTLLGNLG